MKQRCSLPVPHVIGPLAQAAGRQQAGRRLNSPRASSARSLAPRLLLLLVVAAGAVSPLCADSIILPQTGQDRCYDIYGNEIDCALLGQTQDGAVRAGLPWPDPRFADNGDGTMTDNLTGLIWLKEGNCLPTETWANTFTRIADFNDIAEDPGRYGCAGYIPPYKNDWRLPNVVEQESLLHMGKNDTVSWLNFSQGFVNIYKYSQITSTTLAADVAQFWKVDIVVGFTPRQAKAGGHTFFMLVRRDSTGPAQLWRTGQTVSYDPNAPPTDDGALQKGVTWPAPRFTDNGDGTVTDNLTLLVWLADANCIASHYPAFDTDGTAGDGRVLWKKALDFVDGMNVGTYPLCAGGRSDWRLANRKELWSLVDFSQQDPALPPTYAAFFSHVGNELYWSSTSNVDSPISAFGVDFGIGKMSDGYKPGYHHLVWPVAGGMTSSCMPTLNVHWPPQPPGGDPQSTIDQCEVQINGAVTADAGCPAVARVTWNWGDGTVADSWFPASHTYDADSGAQLVTATAYDVGGGWARDTRYVNPWDCYEPDSCGYPNTRDLSHVTLWSTETIQACRRVDVGPDFRLLPPGDVTLRAGKTVAVHSDVEVEKNCPFTAVIDPSLHP